MNKKERRALKKAEKAAQAAQVVTKVEATAVEAEATVAETEAPKATKGKGKGKGKGNASAPKTDAPKDETKKVGGKARIPQQDIDDALQLIKKEGDKDQVARAEELTVIRTSLDSLQKKWLFRLSWNIEQRLLKEANAPKEEPAKAETEAPKKGKKGKAKAEKAEMTPSEEKTEPAAEPKAETPAPAPKGKGKAKGKAETAEANA